MFPAPELLRSSKTSVHVDNWSLGCIIYYLCFKQQPFTTKENVLKGKYRIPKNEYSNQILDIMRMSLKINVNKRLTINQIINYFNRLDF